MTTAVYPRLLADVGVTHARFASQLGPGEPLSAVARYACADFETLWDAICHHLWRAGLEPPRAAIVAAVPPGAEVLYQPTNQSRFALSYFGPDPAPATKP